MTGTRDEYEAAVRAILAASDNRLAAGESAEAIARDAVNLRNALKVRFREGLPAGIIAEMERRNIEKYGHAIGPTPEWLFEKYGTWDAVVRASARPATLRKSVRATILRPSGD